ncbi:amino acid adenylation domain-containing protein [Desulfonema magnum]|uniref:Amino acid adenylation domain-containing protein n=1 Tax=Desulfonema magnum TaxID=45655 RepID=A0A975BMD6_9BACT|nr:amino acid adenylation domain-containing protein [Desulfonema magnum]QTA87828.1 Amino acid adenylation domain-containing protein [Desulfonema magnum]
MTYLLSQLLTQSTRAHAERPAVVNRKDQLTYGDLDELSNRFAHQLQQVGVTRGDRVGLYVEKSLEAVAAIFGVLKIGAAYVPLDPAAPIRRIAYIIENCQMKALMSTTRKMAAFQKASQARNTPASVLVDDPQSLATASADPPSFPQAIENDLAYILYTSGSTGTPKGVMISHRASLTFVNWAYDQFQLRPTDRVSSHAPFHFDLSIFDIFATIRAGGTMVLVPPSLSVFPINLAKFIAEQKITIWYSVPSILTSLVLRGNLAEQDLSALRTILFAGEVFPIKYLRQLVDFVPHAEYYNLYGPTETNVCTYYHLRPADLSPDRNQALSIGRACANTETFVVNETGHIVSPGEVGELYVRGPGIMNGYWGLPEKTGTVLTPCPVPALPGTEIVCRTGDLVRETPDGDYIFLGRRDNMVKSRGYRIELDEIETVLYNHPAIESLAVIAVPDEEVTNIIQAMVVCRTGQTVSQSELQGFCAQSLPKYMIPDTIEFRENLPKTSTGKVDKTSLRREAME